MLCKYRDCFTEFALNKVNVFQINNAIFRSKYKKCSKYISQFAFYIVILCLPFALTLCKKDKLSDVQYDFFVKFFGVSGKNLGSDVCQTNDGGYVILGTSLLPGKGTDITLIKTDKFGNEEWTKTFGDSLDDYAKSVRITSDGGYIFLGTTASKILLTEQQTDMYLVKTDNRGNLSWSRKFGNASTNQEGNCVQQTSDNGFILTGSTTEENLTNQNPDGTKDILLIKTDASGNLIWSQSRGGKNDDVGNYIQQKSDSGYVIIGSTVSFADPGQDKSNIIVYKTNKNGFEISVNYFGGMNDDYGECIQILSDNNYIITGTYGFSNNTTGMYVAKLKENILDTLWTKTIETSSGTIGKSIQETTDKGFIFTGTSGKPGNKDICLVKFLSDGTIDFTKYFGEIGGEENGNTVKQTTDGGFVIAGTNSYEGPSMITLIKTNAKGEQK